MNSEALRMFRASVLALAAGATLTLVACGGGPGSAANRATPDGPRPQIQADQADAGGGAAPDTGAMGQIVLEKINANPAVEGKATLIEFRQKSISTQALGDLMMSAVVEFEGVVTFSSDVQWSWQGPTKAGEPQKFEARAEYINPGDGWQLEQPLGIYPL